MKSQPWRLDDVSARFDSVVALHRVSLTIEPGDIVGFVGPSGSGKTTLLRILQTATPPTTGKITFGDVDYADLTGRALQQHRSRIGFVPQSNALIPNQSVLYNVAAGRLGRKGFWSATRALLLPSEKETEAVYQVLERVGIPEKIYQRADELSGGQQQRVAVARTLYQEPAVILADEPVSNMDPARSRSTLELLTDVAREEKLTLCLSLHDVELARAYCPRLIGLRNGSIAFDRTPAEVSVSDFAALYNLSTTEILQDG